MSDPQFLRAPYPPYRQPHETMQPNFYYPPPQVPAHAPREPTGTFGMQRLPPVTAFSSFNPWFQLNRQPYAPPNHVPPRNYYPMNQGSMAMTAPNLNLNLAVSSAKPEPPRPSTSNTVLGPSGLPAPPLPLPSPQLQVRVPRKRNRVTEPTPWTKEEHRLFLIGLKKYGRGNWRPLARDVLKTRTSAQIASHAQKYFQHLASESEGNKKRRRSVFAIPLEELEKASKAARTDDDDAEAKEDQDGSAKDDNSSHKEETKDDNCASQREGAEAPPEKDCSTPGTMPDTEDGFTTDNA